MLHKPVVLIYRNNLLPASETFVQKQAEALRDFIPYYVGSRLVQGLQLPQERRIALNQGGLLGLTNELSYKLWGKTSVDFVRSLQRLHPALIHAHFAPDGAIALPLAQCLQVPLVVTFHGYDATMHDKYAKASFWSHRVYLRRRELLKQKARLFIAVSESIKRKLLEQDFPSNKVVVHHIGVDTETFQPDPSVQRRPIVLFVGRLAEKKGCKYLIQAMNQVQAVMPDVELVIIGDGPLRVDLENMAAIKLRRYRFLGTQPPQVVKNWMNQALLLAAPSVTAATGDSEGLPIVLIEAQAMGLPVVSSMHSGIPDAILHGQTGFLARERDWRTLAEYILLLLNDRTLWQQLSQNGQERVRTRFNLRSQTSILEDIYYTTLRPKVSTQIVHNSISQS
ncbi:glycosyltransferase [Chroococcidiopsis thermalis]|uniref:Glycosyl transferase group 1 n=1 Tax=Chroococcidiopsis thermalis (strain PCC 7203) TaxID=251229 RepID=K9U084_CHRTP|nr:glycosyltransferase [Chroococcidiopsis thermalis]AFY87654.1 glycosyl transferase group 1 [Chroococcidiopsis thermalis PCC 7203]PSB49837.1 glycosyl transferase [Cyanosarcina cf. burmensis CCALA 770]